jgi:hypothetical protein
MINIYFYQCFENILHPLCSKVMPAFNLAQALSMCMLQSLWKLPVQQQMNMPCTHALSYSVS